MRTPQATPASPTTSSRAATVRASSIATAFLTGTAAISLLVAPAAAAAPVQTSATTGVQASVSTTWGHDDRRDNHSWTGWTKPTPAPSETKTVAWLMPQSTGPWVSWPQELSTTGTLPDCGTGWYQVDVYRYGTAAEKKFVDDFMSDGILTGPSEDGAAYIRHDFLQPANDPAKCAPTTPAEPTTPTVPAVPAVPAEPGTPGTPTVPAVPAVPAVPGTPTTPPVTETPVPEVPTAEVPAAEVPAVETPAVVPPVQNPPVDNATPVVVVPPPAASTPPVSGVGSAFGEAPAPTVVPPVTRPSTATPPVAVVTEDGALAVTGAKVGLLSALAAVLVAAGVVAFRISRRTRATK